MWKSYNLGTIMLFPKGIFSPPRPKTKKKGKTLFSPLMSFIKNSPSPDLIKLPSKDSEKILKDLKVNKNPEIKDGIKVGSSLKPL